MYSFYKNPMSNFVRVWGLWNNFVKVCLSSVLGPLGVACCFPGWKLWQYGWSALWDFNKKYRTFCKNAQSATYLDAWWNPAKIPFMSGSWCVPLGSYALPVDMIALLEEQQFWQLWHTELFSEKTCLIFGTQPDGFECVNSCHCNSSPAAEIVVPTIQQKVALWARSWNSKKRLKGYLVVTESSIIQLLKSCIIIRTHNSSCHSIV